MPRVAPPDPRARPAAPARRATPTLGEPRDLRDRPTGLAMAWRRWRRRGRPMLLGATALAAAILLGLTWQATRHEASLTGLRDRLGGIGALFGLRVEHLVVQGRTATPAPLLAAAIGVNPGDPLLGVSVAAARTRITSIASIADATVERRFPSTILVSLVERHPFAVWQNDHRFVLIDRDGSLLADQDVRMAGALPLVVGAGAATAAAPLIDAIGRHAAIHDHLVAAQRVGDRRWNLVMTSGARVLLPEADQPEDLNRVLDRLDRLQADHQLLDRRLKVVDLRLPDRTVLSPDIAAAPATATTPAQDDPAAAKPAHPPAKPAEPVLTPVARSPRTPT